MGAVGWYKSAGAMGEINTYREIAKRIAVLNEVAVISHMRPDGDAVGSALGLGLALQSLGKRVHMWIEDGVPARFSFLDGAQYVADPPASLPTGVDGVICVDCGEPRRLGDAGRRLVESSPFTINIDHHETNTLYGDMNLVQAGAAACACVVVPLLDELGAPISPSVACALYVGLSTDTGSFQYGSTTARDMRLGARLIECGVNVGDTNRRLYQEQPAGAFAVQREVLNNMVIEENGQLVHYSLPAGKCAELGVGREETKDLVDIIRVLQGARVALIFEDLENGLIRISLRSKDPAIRVNDIASRFGGGGHAMAAGIRMRGSLGEVRSAVLEAIRSVLDSAA